VRGEQLARQQCEFGDLTKYYPEAEDAGIGIVQTWTKLDIQYNTNAHNRCSLVGPAEIFRSTHAFRSEFFRIIVTAHFRGLDMYQVGVPMTTSLCLTTNPNFL
jgi:hypothetical protein